MNLDLYSLGTSLQADQANILMQLLTVMNEQNGALSYFTLQHPPAIT